MGRPFLLAQLSDPHIGGDWGDGDPAAKLAAAVASVCALPQAPDAVLVSGDLVDHGTDAEYEHVRELLAPLRMPTYVLPGNHDERRTLRRHFDLPGSGDEPIEYAVDLGPLRLVVLDTTRPGEAAGALDATRLGWLDAELSAAPEALTLIAMHHPPFSTGSPAWDAVGLPDSDRRALGDVIACHPQVRRLVAGHVHSTTTGDVAGRPALTVPSTYVQLRLDYGSDEFEVASDPAGFAVHAVLEGQVTSQIRPIADRHRAQSDDGARLAA